MRITKTKLRRILRKVITESMNPKPEEGSIEDIINMCVRECERNPDADVESVCERWLEMYGIPYGEYQGVIEAVYRRL